MDTKRTRLRSQAAVSKVFSAVHAPVRKDSLQGANVVEVEVEVEGEHERALLVRGVKKRKRDPRGVGRRLQPKVESQEGSVSVIVEDNGDASSDEINKPNERYGSYNSNEVMPSSAASPSAVNTYVIIPEIMFQDQVVMKQLDKRRESSRLRVKPSKFREGFLLSSIKQKGDQRTAEDVTTALEIVLPMEVQNAGAAFDNTRGSTGSLVPETEIQRKHERPLQISAVKNKVKFSHKSGGATTSETLEGAGGSSLSAKKGIDEIGLKSALAVVKRIMQIKSAEPFNEPVDPIALEIPDYHDVIKQPMDLGTIRELLEGGKKYKTVKEVLDDVQLVWSNCRDYNQEGDPIMDILKIAENCFNKYWNAAGLPVFPPLPKALMPVPNPDFDLSESTDEQSLQEREETKRRKSKDSKFVAMTNLSKGGQVEKPTSKSKTYRSASVEQVMAESKAREDKFEVEDAVLVQHNFQSSQAQAFDEVVEEQLQSTVDESIHSPRDVAKSFSETKHTDVQTPVDQGAGIASEDKGNLLRGSASNKRRTFGTVHHKPDCSCVVCVGRRRKLARQEREGITAVDKKDKSKSHRRLPQENSQAIQAQVLKVTRPPKPPQVQDNMAGSAALGEKEAALEPDRTDSQMGTCGEVDELVEGARYYPATYDLPLRKVNPLLLHVGQVIFDNSVDNVWGRHHSLRSRLPPSNLKSSMFEAVHSLTLNER